MGKKNLIILVLISFILLMSLVRSEILITQPSSLYNLGDNLNVTVTLSPTIDTTDFLNVALECANGEFELYRSPYTIKSGSQQVIPLSINLDPTFVGDASGTCFIKSDYGGQEVLSQYFTITNEIDSTVSVQGTSFSPGSSVTISGTAIRKDGQLVNGFVQATISSLNLSVLQVVSNGNYSINFNFPSNIPSGTYNANLFIYETDNTGNITNQGNNSAILDISAVATNITIDLSSTDIVPFNNFTYTVNIYDQAGNNITDNVPVTIYNPDNDIYIAKIIQSGTPYTMYIDNSYQPHYWNIKASYGSLSASRQFIIEELENASFQLVNNTIVIANTGNVPYTKDVEIGIGNFSQIETLNLGVGSYKSFQVEAANGSYNVSVLAGNISNLIGYVQGTGSVVAIKDPSSIGTTSKIIIWVILIIIILLILSYIISKRKRKEKKPIFSTSRDIPKDKVLNTINKGMVSNAMDIKKGERENGSVIALKINNLSEIKKSDNNASEFLTKAMSVAKNAKAKVQEQDKYYTIIFTKSTTREEDNSLLALKVAREIQSLLIDYNKRFKQKIDFGIGVNNGELIVESNEGKFKFSSLKDTISLAKRASESANSELLITDSIHSIVRSKTKSDKVKDTFWRINEVRDEAKYSGFVKGFLNRQEKDKKKEDQ